MPSGSIALRHLCALCALLSLPGLFLACSKAIGSGAPLTVGAVSSLDRVSAFGEIHTSPTVRLHAARGEYQGFQLVVDTHGGPLPSVRISASDLHSADAVIPRANLMLYREQYVHVTQGSPDFGGSNRPSGPGWYADPLIPIAANGSALPAARSTSAGQDQPSGRCVFWIDVFVPRSSSPGSYRGEISVFNNREQLRFPVSLEVWHQTAPLTPSLKSSFGIHHNRDARFAELLLQHRLMPFLIDPANSAHYRDRFGLDRSGLWLFGEANVRTCRMDAAPPVPTIRKAMAPYPSNVSTYVYAADEIDVCPAMFPTLRAWARNVHFAGARTLVTVTPTEALLDDGTGSGRSAVDTWVLLPKMFATARPLLRRVLQKGDEVWSYNCLVQDRESPKWQIDFAPMNYRIQPGFLNQSLSVSGLLYWQVDNWNEDPWHDASSLRESGYTFPGEGLLVYPGTEIGVDGPVPSLRLKWLRDGVQDYEAIEMLKRAGRGDWALGVVRSVASDWSHWTRSTAALEEARLTLGEELNRLELEQTANKKSPARLVAHPRIFVQGKRAA